MPRRPDLDRPTRLELKLPESIRTRLDLLLYSELEKKVPQGRYQAFFLERITEFFDWRRLDLTPYGFAPGSYVSGTKQTLDSLQQALDEIRADNAT